MEHNGHIMTIGTKNKTVNIRKTRIRHFLQKRKTAVSANLTTQEERRTTPLSKKSKKNHGDASFFAYCLR
jgi:ribosomal protein L9